MSVTLKSILELSAKETLSDYVTAIAWSPMGNTVAVASGSGEVRLLKNFVSLSLCQPTGQSIDALAFSFDGKWLATGGQDGTITLWQMEGDVPEIADTLECGSWVDRLVWHPTCHYLAFNQGKTVQIWDADRAEAVTSLAGIANPQDVRWSPDGKHLAIAIKSNIYLWNRQDWSAPRYQWELTSPASAIAWSPDGSLLACAIHDHSIGVLNWSTAQHLQREPTDENDLPTLMRGFPGKIRQLAWADLPPLADLPPILAAATRELVTMWMQSPEGWDSWVLNLHSDTVLDVAFQPKTGWLASLSEDGWIILWQAALEAVQVLEGAEAGFSCLAWHPMGHHLAAGGQRGELFVWSTGSDR
ncbi:WD40 repeat domain-containing protein [Alkalinema pantanalense CENA528]|uniref:WD40 repeat domain-containing protein n=1 Tax=Alkalinema pantanalense TaxID=1620705 RepID=UPI003D6E7DBB